MARKFYTVLEILARQSLRLYDTDSGEYVGLRAPDTVTSNYTLSLPSTAGSSGQALTTNGTDTLSWASYISSVSSPTDNAIPKFDGTGGTTLQNSGVLIDDSNNITGVGALTTSGTITTGLTASRALITNGTSQIAVSSVTSTELGYVSGVTSGIQGQIDALPSKVASDWVSGDGTSKVVNHGLNSKDVVVSVYDKSNDEEILVDTITRTDVNNITLTSSEAPNASGWRVVIIG